jgi:hypothetical protein
VRALEKERRVFTRRRGAAEKKKSGCAFGAKKIKPSLRGGEADEATQKASNTEFAAFWVASLRSQ